MVPHGDFLARCADLEGDEISLFTIAFFTMLERRGPIDDDMQWLGRKAGISTRRANQIRVKLLDHGKWQLRAGQIGDPAALAIVDRANKRSEINRTNALARWEAAGQPELDFDKKPERSPGKRRKSAVSKDAIASPAPPAGAGMQTGAKNGEKPGKNATKTREHDGLIGQEIEEIQGEAPEIRTPDSRTRATPESELDSDHTNESEVCEPRPQRDRAATFAAVVKAAGFRPSSPEASDAARAMVASWTHDGIDLDATILPTIRTMVAASDDPTSSLKRFDRTIRYEHARAAAKPAPGPSAPPMKPPDDWAPGPDDSDERLEQIRATLRRDCGARTYEGWLRPAHLGLDADGNLIVTLPSQFMADWVLTHFADRFRSLARSLGITKVMIGAGTPKRPENGNRT